jgi:hypothetical protein
MLVTTLSVAVLLVTELAPLVTTHRYSVPFNAAVGLLTLNLVVVTPLYGEPFDRLDHTPLARTCH